MYVSSSGAVGEANGATAPLSMMDRVTKRLRKAAFATSATPTGETEQLAYMAFRVYSAIVEYADDEEESQDISGMCISHAGMEGKSSFPPAPPASAALTALATSAVTALNAYLMSTSNGTGDPILSTNDGHLKPAAGEKRKSPQRGEKLSYINISDGAIAEEAIASSTKKLKSSSIAKSADGDVISIESSEDEGDDVQSQIVDSQKNKLLLVYPFDVDEKLLRKASRGLLELGGNLLGVLQSLEDQPDEDDVTRVTRMPPRRHNVVICDDDYERLSPGIFLNDALVDFWDFWMRWISRGESQLPSSDVLFFTSHFMTNLKKNGHEAVVSWTKKKGINIFEKKLIFIPVNADVHWSLLVVVNPGLIANFYTEDLPETEEHSFILFLDSLKMHNKDEYATHIRQWLHSEHRRLGRGEVGGRVYPFTKDSIPVVSPKIPLQDDGCDCGVFVCRYAYNLYIMRRHCFTWKGYKANFASLITNSPAFQFDMSDIARIRKEMTTLVNNLSKLYLPWLKVPGGEPTTACTSMSSDADGEVTNEEEEDGVGGMWELTKIYSLNELKKSKPIMCSNDDCDLVACSRWESTEGEKQSWNSCLDCQAADFDGWPGRDEQELPVVSTSKTHQYYQFNHFIRFWS